MSSFRRSVFAAVAAVIFLGFPVVPSRAASVVWQTPQTVSGDTDVATNGTVAYAYNFGDVNAPATTTVNTVAFTAWKTANADSAGPVTVGSVTLGPTLIHSAGFQGGATPYTNLSTNYKTLLSSGVYGDNPNVSMTVTLLNLTPGQRYQVELWAEDSRGVGGTPRREEAVQGGSNTSGLLDFNVSDANGGLGQLVIGAFTADATSQLLSLIPHDQDNNPGNAYPQINGLELAQLPEPASASLLALGSVLMLRRRV